MPKIPTKREIVKPLPAVEEVVVGTPTKRFSFQPPIPLCSDGSSAGSSDLLLAKNCVSGASHKTGITLDEMGKPPEERFTFRPPLPLRSESSMEEPKAKILYKVIKKVRFKLGENGQPVVDRIIFQPALPLNVPLKVPQPKWQRTVCPVPHRDAADEDKDPVAKAEIRPRYELRPRLESLIDRRTLSRRNTSDTSPAGSPIPAESERWTARARTYEVSGPNSRPASPSSETSSLSPRKQEGPDA